MEDASCIDDGAGNELEERDEPSAKLRARSEASVSGEKNTLMSSTIPNRPFHSITFIIKDNNTTHFLYPPTPYISDSSPSPKEVKEVKVKQSPKHSQEPHTRRDQTKQNAGVVTVSKTKKQKSEAPVDAATKQKATTQQVQSAQQTQPVQQAEKKQQVTVVAPVAPPFIPTEDLTQSQSPMAAQNTPWYSGVDYDYQVDRVNGAERRRPRGRPGYHPVMQYEPNLIPKLQYDPRRRKFIHRWVEDPADYQRQGGWRGRGPAHFMDPRQYIQPSAQSPDESAAQTSAPAQVQAPAQAQVHAQSPVPASASAPVQTITATIPLTTSQVPAMVQIPVTIQMPAPQAPPASQPQTAMPAAQNSTNQAQQTAQAQPSRSKHGSSTTRSSRAHQLHNWPPNYPQFPSYPGMPFMPYGGMPPLHPWYPSGDPYMPAMPYPPRQGSPSQTDSKISGASSGKDTKSSKHLEPEISKSKSKGKPSTSPKNANEKQSKEAHSKSPKESAPKTPKESTHNSKEATPKSSKKSSPKSSAKSNKKQEDIIEVSTKKTKTSDKASDHKGDSNSNQQELEKVEKKESAIVKFKSKTPGKQSQSNKVDAEKQKESKNKTAKSNKSATEAKSDEADRKDKKKSSRVSAAEPAKDDKPGSVASKSYVSAKASSDSKHSKSDVVATSAAGSHARSEQTTQRSGKGSVRSDCAIEEAQELNANSSAVTKRENGLLAEQQQQSQHGSNRSVRSSSGGVRIAIAGALAMRQGEFNGRTNHTARVKSWRTHRSANNDVSWWIYSTTRQQVHIEQAASSSEVDITQTRDSWHYTKSSHRHKHKAPRRVIELESSNNSRSASSERSFVTQEILDQEVQQRTMASRKSTMATSSHPRSLDTKSTRRLLPAPGDASAAVQETSSHSRVSRKDFAESTHRRTSRHDNIPRSEASGSTRSNGSSASLSPPFERPEHSRKWHSRNNTAELWPQAEPPADMWQPYLPSIHPHESASQVSAPASSPTPIHYERRSRTNHRSHNLHTGTSNLSKRALNRKEVTTAPLSNSSSSGPSHQGSHENQKRWDVVVVEHESSTRNRSSRSSKSSGATGHTMYSAGIKPTSIRGGGGQTRSMRDDVPITTKDDTPWGEEDVSTPGIRVTVSRRRQREDEW